MVRSKALADPTARASLPHLRPLPGTPDVFAIPKDRQPLASLSGILRRLDQLCIRILCSLDHSRGEHRNGWNSLIGRACIDGLSPP